MIIQIMRILYTKINNYQMKKRTLYLLCFFTLTFNLKLESKLVSAGDVFISSSELPSIFQGAIKEIKIDRIGNANAVQKITTINSNTVRVSLSFDLTEDVTQDDWRISVSPAFQPTFNWAPHLTPTDNNIIDQHVFRTPALIASDEKQVLVVIPDINILKKENPVRWYMDMNARENLLNLGMSKTKVTEHVFYERTPGAFYPK